MGPIATIKYTGSTPGADSNTYNLLNSITSKWPGNWAAMFGVKKVILVLKHTQAGTVKWYTSEDDVYTASPTWNQIGESSITAPASTDGSIVEIPVETDRHTKIDWVNGGVAQASFYPHMSLSDERSAL